MFICDLSSLPKCGLRNCVVLFCWSSSLSLPIFLILPLDLEVLNCRQYNFAFLQYDHHQFFQFIFFDIPLDDNEIEIHLPEANEFQLQHNQLLQTPPKKWSTIFRQVKTRECPQIDACEQIDLRGHHVDPRGHLHGST